MEVDLLCLQIDSRYASFFEVISISPLFLNIHSICFFLQMYYNLSKVLVERVSRIIGTGMVSLPATLSNLPALQYRQWGGSFWFPETGSRLVGGGPSNHLLHPQGSRGTGRGLGQDRSCCNRRSRSRFSIHWLCLRSVTIFSPPNSLKDDVGHQVLPEEGAYVLGLHVDSVFAHAHSHLGRQCSIHKCHVSFQGV